MKAIQTALILAGLCVSSTGFAAQPIDKEAAKQAALDTCLAKAKERYGSAFTNSKPKKRKVGKIRGYSYILRVGNRNKKMVCVADANGETIIFAGSR